MDAQAKLEKLIEDGLVYKNTTLLEEDGEYYINDCSLKSIIVVGNSCPCGTHNSCDEPIRLYLS